MQNHFLRQFTVVTRVANFIVYSIFLIIGEMLCEREQSLKLPSCLCIIWPKLRNKLKMAATVGRWTAKCFMAKAWRAKQNSYSTSASLVGGIPTLEKYLADLPRTICQVGGTRGSIAE